jgi:hypothetical protein
MVEDPGVVVTLNVSLLESTAVLSMIAEYGDEAPHLKAISSIANYSDACACFVLMRSQSLESDPLAPTRERAGGEGTELY